MLAGLDSSQPWRHRRQEISFLAPGLSLLPRFVLFNSKWSVE